MKIPVGQQLELKLRRAGREYVVLCAVESEEGTELLLRLEDGRQLRVPAEAVSGFVEIAEHATSGDGRCTSDVDAATTSRLAAHLRESVLGKGRNVSASAWNDATSYIEARLVEISDGDARNAIRALLRGIRLIHQQWLEPHFERRERTHHEAESALTDAAKAIEAAGLTELAEIAKELKEVAESDETAFLKESNAHVHLDSSSRDETYHVQKDHILNWTVSLSTHEGGPPIEQPQVLIKSNDQVQPIGTARGPAILAGGGRCEIQVPMQVDHKALEEGSVNFTAQVRYRRHDGNQILTRQERFSVSLRPEEEFTKIVNPYSRFSGGAVVDDNRMFFGRGDLIERITEIVTQGTSGQCFVLYGQKRTGKTSVLRQLENGINPPFLPVRVSVGAIDTGDADISFIQQCIDALYFRLLDLGVTDLVDTGWPSDQRISARPLESFRRAFFGGSTRLSKKAGWKGCRPVLLIDEFTYMYEYIKEGRAESSFMRQWKALLETGLFNAVIVGQDSMPRFKAAFPNEFGVTHDERISYLSSQDAKRLADDPLQLSDKSTRYRGYSLEKLIGLTAGNPFYEMILCDNVVRHLNDNGLTHVTERVIDQVVESMCVGPSALSSDRFDSLITAAGESVALASREAYRSCLEAIALLEDDDGSAYQSQQIDGALVDDLVMRDVVMRLADGRLSIRVPLFSRWLRAQASDG